MAGFTLPYPNAYNKDNSYYIFTDPITGERIEYIAGQDGIDERWIEIIKEEDRRTNAEEKRFERWRKKQDGTGYARTLLSLEEISIDKIENSKLMSDPNPNAEQLVIARQDAADFTTAYSRALSTLSDSLRAVWTLYVDNNLSISDIADHLAIPYETVKKRLQRARKQLQKEFRKKA